MSDVSRRVGELSLFERAPHRSFLALAVPVMAAMVVEPLAGLVDTAFVERLGVAPAAALGAATALLSSAVWVFNFLGVATQTEVAQSLGQGDTARASSDARLGVALAALVGTLAAGVAWPFVGAGAAWMTGDPVVVAHVVTYLEIRLLGVPAALVLLAAFGALRGMQDMRSPLWIAAGVTAVNVALDAVLVFGVGPIPGFGIAGAAWATVASQIAGAGAAWKVVVRRLEPGTYLDWRRARRHGVVGRDMVLRTAALLAFLLLATRAALHAGTDAGAAHQALRQVWMMLAFVLDAFAVAGQSLIGFFVGAGRRELARRAAGVATVWALGFGFVIAAGLLVARPGIELLLVPPAASGVFATAWFACLVAQPLNALAFVTDGIHWGTGDYAYLRNAMLVSTAVACTALVSIDLTSARALGVIWWLTGGWIALRAAAGLARVWPGSTSAPLGRARRISARAPGAAPDAR